MDQFARSNEVLPPKFNLFDLPVQSQYNRHLDELSSFKVRCAVPIYEYGCYDCHKRVNVFFRSFSDVETKAALCPRCGGENLKRLISRVAVVRSEESRLESLADPGQLTGLDENDPKSMARWMRRMGQEIGEDLGSEFNEVIDRLEAGEDPESIEQSVSALSGGADDDWFG
jgi:putative FmdB family regulatory protein